MTIITKNLVTLALIALSMSNFLNAQVENSPNFITCYFSFTDLDYLPGKFQTGRQFHHSFAAVMQDSLWGFIDLKGHVTVPFDFDEVSDFYKGYAAAKKEEAWGVIDTKGRWVLAPSFITLSPLLAKDQVFLIAQNDERYYGIIDPDGRVILDFNYVLILPTFAKTFRHINAFVAHEGLNPDNIHQHYIPLKVALYELPETQVEVYNQQWEKQLTISNQSMRFRLLPFRKEWIDENGNIFPEFPTSDEDIDVTKHDLIEYELLDSLNSFVYEDEYGKMGVKIGNDLPIIPPDFQSVSARLDFVHSVSKDQVDFIKSHFRAHLLPDQYMGKAFYIYYYLVEKNGKFGVYSLRGNEIIAPLYEDIQAHGLGFVISEKRTKSLTDFSGKTLFPFSRDYAYFSEPTNDRLVLSIERQEEGMNQSFQALANPQGEILTPLYRYTHIDPFYGEVTEETYHHAQVTKRHLSTLLSGIIHRDGTEILPPIYKYVTFYSGTGLAVLQDAGQPKRYYIYDLKQRKIVKTIENVTYQFLIGTAKEGILKIVQKEEK